MSEWISGCPHCGDARDYVFCPFTDDGVCIGGCLLNRERSCVNGDDDE